MEFFVVGPDGNKFGPASLETLNKWAAEGRVVATTILERASDGVRGPASLLPGLTIPASSTPSTPADAPGAPAATTPTTPAGSAPGTPGTAAPGTPDIPSTAGQPSRAHFKEMDVPASAGERMTPPTYGPGMTPPQPGMTPSQPGAYPGYSRQASYRYDVVPPELSGKFNWGAFFLTWIWGLNHRAYLTLITLGVWALGFAVGFLRAGSAISTGAGTPGAQPGTRTGGADPIGLLFLAVILGLKVLWGIKGYEWAWVSARFTDPEKCKRTQNTWGWWGFGLTMAVCGCGIVLLATVFAAVFAMLKGMSAH